MLNEGDKIPAFSLPDQTGKKRNFKNLAGENGLVIYVYSKDNTSGCTAEAQEFRDLHVKLQKKGFNVVGLSKDSVASHAKFAEKHELPFPLLADEEKVLLDKLGAWIERIRCGKPGMAALRNSYVFDSKGKLIKGYKNVKARGHAENVVADLG